MAKVAPTGAINVPTYVDSDSGASDHWFVSISDFVTYEACMQPHEGQSAHGDGIFWILGKGNVVKTLVHKGVKRSITFIPALHAPDLLILCLASLGSPSYLLGKTATRLGLKLIDMHQTPMKLLRSGVTVPS
ncbi:hypothetical protein BD779DRAFT_1675585 [Infundibulicybe gibba]|nr:hypothetical protein BD779DRAFT_1675585 [Infundibulicybe gibba]